MEEATLLQALKDARAKETARLEAMFKIQDVSALRLMALHDHLAAESDGGFAGQQLLTLDTKDGDMPRLWLDLNTFVAMEPNAKTYSLIQIDGTGRKTILETTDFEVIKRFALKHLAHALVSNAQQRKVETKTWRDVQFNLFDIITVGLLGLLTGVLGLFLWGLYAGLLRIQ